MNLSELFATWQAWHARDVAEQATRRAEADGRDDVAAEIRRDLAEDMNSPRAIEALTAQHELAERLGDWRWHTITAAREQGATWNDVAAATGTDPTTAQQAYRYRAAQAGQAAAELDIPLPDAERYRAAAADDTDDPATADTRAETGQETAMTTQGNDDQIEHISGPEVFEDGLVVREIALPGGLPADEDDEDDIPRWDQAWSIADRDGYVLFDPETSGGFRALSPAERAEFTDTVRAGTPPELTRGSDTHAEAGGPEAPADSAEQVDPWLTADGSPWVDNPEGIAERERWAVENADPTKGLDDSHPDDLDRLQQRLDHLRMQLTGYTWREDVDRDQALADRREQLGRWYDDDHADEQTDASGDAEVSSDADGILPHCLIHPDDPEWSQ